MSLRALARDTARLVGANVATKFISVAALAVYARLLTPVELAALPVFWMLGGFSNVPFNFGFFPTLLREVPRLLETDVHQARALLRTVVVATGAGVLVVTGAYALLAVPIAATYFADPGRSDLIWWMLVGCVFRGFDEIASYVLRSTQMFKPLAVKKLISELGQPLCGLAMVPFFGIRGLLVGLTLGLVAGVVYVVIVAREHLFARTEMLPVGPMIGRSKAYYVEGFVFFATQQGDQALVGALLSPVALAGYYIARRLIDALGLILTAFDEVLTPSLSRASALDPAVLAKTQRLLSFGVGVFAIPAGAAAAVLAPTYVKIMGGTHFAGIVPAVAILSLGLWPLAATSVSWQLTLALGRPADRLRISGVFAILLIVFTTFTASHGLGAVASGRLVALSLTAVFGAVTARKLSNPIRWRDTVALLVSSAAMCACIVGAEMYTSQLLAIALASALGAAVFALTLFITLDPSMRAPLTASLARRFSAERAPGR